MNTLTDLGERIIKTEKELDQYKTAHNKLTAGLKEAVAESIKYKRERDSLIKDVEKLREEVKSLNRETTKYFEHWQEIFGIYSKLTEHIRDKAWSNPGNSRYIALVHFIDEIEGE
ncbi:hypothetical protein PYH58_08155 [Mammaliicoccus sciuri]|uniref:hypothetical protein n=1 Tax=Mammaliicoccus sciuri TaxID=1296 RepID=UPI00336508B7